MLPLLLAVIPLGIGAAFTPSLFALQLLIVAGDPWRMRALGAFLGAALAFGIAVTLLLLGFARLPSDPMPDVIGGIIRIVAGGVLAGIAIFFVFPHPALEQRVRAQVEAHVASARPIEFFGLTFVLSIKDVSSFVLIIPAMHDIAVADVAWEIKTLVAVLVFALALAGLIIPPILRVLVGRDHSDLLTRLYAATMRNQFRIMAVVFAVLAVYLVVSGIRHL